MNIREANIEIKRHEGKLSSISVIMPRWSKLEHDNSWSVDIPLFGIKTIAKDEEDIEIAIDEAIKCFCITAEKCGLGIERELDAIGWRFIEESSDTSVLTFMVSDSNYIIEQIMQTGEQYANNLELELELA